MKSPSPRLLVTADDRTGALEIGGVVANREFSVPVGITPVQANCSVVDVDTRQVSANLAYERMYDLGRFPSSYRCHKMDSGLRGNWPAEIKALLDLGHAVGIIPGYPEAGRRCIDGVVYIDDVPLLESPFGADPLTAPYSNRPIEVLEDAGVTSGDFVLFNADTVAEVLSDVQRVFKEGRVLVSPTGPIGAYARHVFPNLTPQKVETRKPLLIFCGSLNATSRLQITQLGLTVFDIEDDLNETSPITVLATPEATQTISISQAQDMGQRTADRIKELESHFETLIVIGGDTSAAYIRDQTVDVIGTVATGIPVALFQNRVLITKGGGIGNPDTLVEICQSAD